MGLFKKTQYDTLRLARSIGNAQNSIQKLQLPRQFNAEVQKMKEQLRYTRQYSEIFYSLISNITYPPCFIECTKDGVFWTRDWEENVKNYEPFSTVKMQNSNVDSVVVYAVFKLIQESYPNVYNFPSNTLSRFEAGTELYRLIMIPNYFGFALRPAFVPKTVEQFNSSSSITQGESSYPSANSKKLCTVCGYNNPNGSKFCSKCGNRL